MDLTMFGWLIARNLDMEDREMVGHMLSHGNGAH